MDLTTSSEDIVYLHQKINRGRLLLTKLIGGDYAHAGDKEATEMVICKVLKLFPYVRYGNCLDVGCGSGGTANDVYNLGFPHVYGIDIDKASVAYAQKRYPHVQFICANAAEILQYFEFEFFSLIYFFDVFYAIKDKLFLLKQLATISKRNAILTIVDIHLIKDESCPINDLGNIPIYLIRMEYFKLDLQKAGWEIIEIIDLSNHYIRWYKNIMDQLLERYAELSVEFSEEEIAHVKITLKNLLHGLESGSFGAAVIYARLI